MSILGESSVTPIIPEFQNHRPLRQYLYSNIQSLVRLLDALTMLIFIELLVTPIIPGFQYWMLCMLADFRHSPFQYWWNRWPLRRYLHSNIHSLVRPR